MTRTRRPLLSDVSPRGVELDLDRETLPIDVPVLPVTKASSAPNEGTGRETPVVLRTCLRWARRNQPDVDLPRNGDPSDRIPGTSKRVCPTTDSWPGDGSACVLGNAALNPVVNATIVTTASDRGAFRRWAELGVPQVTPRGAWNG